MSLQAVLAGDEELACFHALVTEIAPELAAEDGAELKMPGVGYGRFRYRYESGRTGETYRLAITRRKVGLSIYCCGIDPEGHSIAQDFVERMPKASIGQACVRLKRLTDVDEGTLRGLIRATVEGAPPQ